MMLGLTGASVDVDILLTALGAIAATWVSLYVGKIRPDRLRRQELERATVERRRQRDRWIDGEVLLDGTKIDGAPQQLHEVKVGLDLVGAGQALLEKRMDEANGTSRQTLARVSEIKVQVDEMAGHWSSVKPVLDALARREAAGGET